MLLKKKLPIAIITLVSLPLFFLSVMVYAYTSSALIEISKNRIRNISQIEGENLNNIILSQKKELQLAAKTKEIIDALTHNYQKDSKESVRIELDLEAKKMLKSALEDSPDLENIFITDLDGKVVISANGEGLNASVKDKQCFIDALNGKTSTSNIVRSDLKKENLVIMATPVKNNKKVIGVLCSSIKLEYFKDRIANVKMDNHGYVYIVDAKGIIVAHPDTDKLGTQIKNETVNSIVKKIKQNEPILSWEGTYTYQQKEKFMAYSIIPDIHWLIIFAEDTEEMNQPARTIFLYIIITTAAFLILSIITSLEFSKSITNPIDQLIEAMDKTAKGELNANCIFKSEDEFGRLSKNYNMMLGQLNQNYEELTDVYEKLSATEEELRKQYDELQVSADQLRKSEEKYKLAIEGSNDVIWEWDNENKKFYISDKWHEIIQEISESMPSLKMFVQRIHKDDLKRVVKSIKDHLENKIPFYISEFRIKSGEEGYRWVMTRGKALRNTKGEVVKVAGSMSDISERKAIEDRISYMAYYDGLTNLPNRMLFMQKLKEVLRESEGKHITGAVMFIDLDNFKYINDTLGHDYGDKLLQVIAQKLKAIVRGKNTVCRFGGDEFLILKQDIISEKQVANLAKVILGLFEEPFFVMDKLIYSTASIGISVFCKDGCDTNTILKNADTAMYFAKALGKNNYVFFNHNMCDDLERKSKIEYILREALINDEFEIYYQPQVDIRNKRITGFEALLRLHSKEMGSISPGEFIPVAESCGLIKEIGDWCLRKACEKNKEWRDKGYAFDYIAVNISPIQFEQSHFNEKIVQILQEVQLEPEFLEIEITESVLMKSLEKNIDILKQLRNSGIKIALDDFGTGYSSFNYLRQLPIHTLKIDKSFIDGICLSVKEQAIAYGIIELAHQMQLQVVAEGVEDNNQLKVLQAQGCDKVQGYYFSKPLPSIEAEKLLQHFDFEKSK